MTEARVEKTLMAVGVILLVIPLAMAIFAPDAFLNALIFLRIMAALGGGLIASQIPGFLKVHFPGVEALGGMAAFALILMYNPLWEGGVKSSETDEPAPTPQGDTAAIDAVEPQAADNAAIERCVSEKVALFQSEKETSVDGGARVSGPGIGGGRETASERVCLSLGPNQEFISASTRELTCHGGRCRVTAPVNEGGRICVTATAWSESNSFGGGGSARYRLIAVYRDLASEEDRARFLAQCRDQSDQSEASGA